VQPPAPQQAATAPAQPHQAAPARQQQQVAPAQPQQQQAAPAQPQQQQQAAPEAQQPAAQQTSEAVEPQQAAPQAQQPAAQQTVAATAVGPQHPAKHSSQQEPQQKQSDVEPANSEAQAEAYSKAAKNMQKQAVNAKKKVPHKSSSLQPNTNKKPEVFANAEKLLKGPSEEETAVADKSPSEVRAEAAAQASAVLWKNQEQNEGAAQKAAEQKSKADVVVQAQQSDTKEAEKRDSETEKKVEKAAEFAAEKSADAATLVSEQRQIVRDEVALPKMARQMTTLESGLTRLSKRDKYGTDVASAIATGIGQIRDGKELNAAPQEYEDIELAESGSPFIPNDSSVNIRAGMEAQAYRQAVAWQNSRSKAEAAMEAQQTSGTESVQQQQAQALALQNAKDQDRSRVALMSEISHVHNEYAHDLAEAKEQAKAKAMKTLTQFAAKIKAGVKPAKALKQADVEARQHTKAQVHPHAAKKSEPSSVKKTSTKPSGSSKNKTDEPNTKPVEKHRTATDKPEHKEKTETVKAVSAPKDEASKIAQEQAKAQEQAIMQAGVERALVDTAKKIRQMKARTRKEVKRETSYFANKQADAIAMMKTDPTVQKKIAKLKKLDNQAQANLKHEEKRLEVRVANGKRVLGEMTKVSEAALEEKAGIKKTASFAKEMKRLSVTEMRTLQSAVRHQMQPNNRVDMITDTGKVVHLSGSEDLGEGASMVSPAAAIIEAKDEKATEEDLKKVKVLEKTGAAAAALFADTAKTTMKESAIAEKTEQKIADAAANIAKHLSREVNQGLALERTGANLASVPSDRAETTPATKAAEHRQKDDSKPSERRAPHQEYDEDLGESQDLGESDDVEEPGHGRAWSPKKEKKKRESMLKKEQFALVNAQTHLNQITKHRRMREDHLAKHLRMKEKTAVETERLDLKAEEKKYQQDASAALKATTKIDEFLASDKKAGAKEHKEFVLMKKEADAAVHDEFIATSSADKTQHQFKEFVDEATGLVKSLHNPDLQAAMIPNSQRKPKKHVPTQQEKLEQASGNERADMDKFIQARAPAAKSGAVDDTEVQPTKAKALLALKEQKADGKLAAAYGRRLEAQKEKEVGTQLPDEQGNGFINTPDLSRENVVNNPQAAMP